MKRLLLLALLGVSALSAQGEDRQWVLTDGRTVTVLKVLSQNATHVTVRCPEGLLQIDKRLLPDAVKPEFPYDASAPAPPAEAQAVAPKRPSERPRAAAPSQAEGDLSIQGLRPAGRARAYLTIVNRSSSLAEVSREMLVGVTVNGVAFPVLRFTDDRGSLFTRIRVLAHGSREICVVLDVPEGEVGDVRGVYWRSAQ